MEPNNQNKSSFGDFLQGYKMRNLRSVQAGMMIKIDLITNLLNELQGHVAKFDDKYPNVKERLAQAISVLAEPKKMDLIPLLADFGQRFATVLGLLRTTDLKDDGFVREIVSVITYEYADGAKTIGDKMLIKIALIIGDELNGLTQ